MSDDQIIYALVSRGSDVLAEHTERTGNFEQVTRQLLKRIPSENKIMSYVYPKEKYVFHYIVDDGITYLCMADEGFGRMVPFRFLEDMKNKFVVTFGDRAKTAIAYSFNPDFQGVIRRLMESANDPRNKTYRSTDSKIYEINEEIESTKNTVLESIEKVLDRGEKIELLVHKSDQLDDQASKFNRHSRKLKNRMRWKNRILLVIQDQLKLTNVGQECSHTFEGDIQCLGANATTVIQTSYINYTLSSITFLVCGTIFVAVIIWKLMQRYSNSIIYQNANSIQIKNQLNEPNLISQNELMNIEQRKNRLINMLDECKEILTSNIVIQLLDDYHVILKHFNQNELMDELVDCEINMCDMFRRNYRDRGMDSFNEEYYSDINDCNSAKSSQDKPNVDMVSIALREIVDKIHCFLYHSMDVITMTNTIQSNEIFNETSKIIQNKVNQKYNQLYSIEHNKFIPGKEFKYVATENKNDIHFDEKHESHIVLVTQKYDSLKEELTTNNIAQIPTEQFIVQLKKAGVHHSSHYRMKNYPSIAKEHLLALMIYCNFDYLQSKFSETYRENFKNHCNFYHLGKLLKVAVIDFGTSIKDGKVTKFYHGVSKKLVPSEIVGALGKGIVIYCPLSTSSDYCVAINFTAANQGLVMTFGGNTSKAKYFCVDWLSDYANEKEHLFLQNKNKLQINGIMDCSTGVEYDEWITGLKAIDAILYEKHHFVDEHSNLRDVLIKTVVSIIQHQLAFKLGCNAQKRWQLVKNLPEYAQLLFKVYFENKTKLSINYSVLEHKYVELFKLICLEDYEWIRFDELKAIFPKIVDMEVQNIDLCAQTMDNILKNAHVFDDSWTLRKMTIKANKSSHLKAADAFNTYCQQYRKCVTKLVLMDLDTDSDEYDKFVIT
eukprot:234989_1